MNDKYVLIVKTVNSKNEDSQFIRYVQDRVQGSEVRILTLFSENDRLECFLAGEHERKEIIGIASVKEAERLFSDAYFIVGMHNPIVEEFVSCLSGRLGIKGFNKCHEFIQDKNEGEIKVYKNIYGGSVEAEVVLKSFEKPVFITLYSKVSDGDWVLLAEYRQYWADSSLFNGQKSVVLFEKKPGIEKQELSEAKVIVAGGRGIQSKADFDLLEELANQLGGAAGASRAAVDQGYALVGQQIGQSGKSIRPDCYFAVGISGSPQHIHGMRNSKLIIALNKDPEAPIYQYADYGIIGDYKEIIPELIEIMQCSDEK